MPLNIEIQKELLAYLKEKRRMNPGESLQMEVLKGGVSNRTVWVKKKYGKAWVMKQALSKLRVREDWFSDPKRIEREALGMKWLSRLLPEGKVPALLFLDKEHHLLAMEAVPQPYDNFKQLLLQGRFFPSYFRHFGELLGQLHQNSQAFQQELEQEFSDRSFFESLRLEPYYEFTARILPEVAPFFFELCDSCRLHRYTIVHGDFSPKNILIHQGRLILLDHEVIHFGDGTFDIGFALCHLLSKAHHLQEYRGALLEGAVLFWKSFLEEMQEWDDAKEQRAVAHTIACLLARVHGRSPLEYLSAQEQAAQSFVALSLIQKRPSTIEGLIHSFINQLSHV